MHADRWLWLYRPTLPSSRAQALQILHAAHAMAGLGVSVTVLAEPGSPALDQAGVLAWAGLPSDGRLQLRLLRGGRTAASLQYRAAAISWARQGPGTLLVRSQQHLVALRRLLPANIRVVLEIHAVAHFVALDGGGDGAAAVAAERQALGLADGVVCNAPGTLRLLREQYPVLPPTLLAENASRADRCLAPASSADGALYLGSVHDWKGLRTLCEGARRAAVPLRLVGPLGEGAAALVGDGVSHAPAVAPREVPSVLAEATIGALPASDSWFGRELTSPLKAWDYRAAGLPIVGANTPAIRAAAGTGLVAYEPGSAAGAASALTRARSLPRTAPDLRSWHDRAASILAFARALP